MQPAVKSFVATYYNPSRISDFSKVICPPYDVINGNDLKRLRKKSPYNFSHILLADHNNYKAKREIFEEWIRQEVLINDTQPSLYLYEQRFKVNGTPHVRFGIMSLLKMDKDGVFPHEYTHRVPKQDRKKIIQALEANLSPIFVVATYQSKILSDVHKQFMHRKPFFSCKDTRGNSNRLWKVRDSRLIRQLCREFSKSKFLIADGHHRFETSFDYFRKNKNKFKDLNYLLAYITDCQKGLVILPTHRIVFVKESEEEMLRTMRFFFTVRKVSEKVLDKKMRLSSSFCLGIYKKSHFYFLALKEEQILAKITNAVYRELDAYIFHKLVLPLLKTGGTIEYAHSVQEARGLAGKRKTAFLLRPASLESVITISRKGLRLPQKSTYFYPKVMSGVVLRRFRR